MKLKESKASVKLAYLLPAFAVAAVICVVIRAIQMRYFIEPETGFFSGGTILNVAFYGILIVSFIAFAVISYISRDSSQTDVASLCDKKLSVVSAVAAFAFVCDSFSQFINAINLFDKIDAMQLEPKFIFKALMSSGTLPSLMQSLFAILSAVYFVIAFKSFKSGSGEISSHKYIAVAPVLWAGFKLIARFIKQISYVQVSDLLLELVMIAFMVMFFMAFAQTASGVYSEDMRWRVTGFGLSSALLALTLNVPRALFTFIKDAVYVNTEYPFCLIDLVYAVFVIVLCLALINKSKNHGENTPDDTL